MLSRCLFATLLLTPQLVSSDDDGFYPVHAPFFVEQHETGIDRVVIFHGTSKGDETYAFCGNEPRPANGHNEAHCFQVDTNEFELQLPYRFERDPDSTVIQGINFKEDPDNRIVIPFSTVLDDHGRMHAVVNAGDSAAYSQIIIPYSIHREGGEVLAIERDDSYEEQVVRLRYRKNEDGSLSVVYDESLDVVAPGATPAVQLGATVAAFVGSAAVVCLIWKRCRRSGREPAGESHELHQRGDPSFA